MRAVSVFTDSTISPNLSLRQRPHRYAIRAGRNLPDKEFRYLRTVIVTAAVYWGFSSKLLEDKSSMTSLINLPAPGRRQTLYIIFRFKQSPVFLLNSRRGHFIVTFSFHISDKQNPEVKGITPSPTLSNLLSISTTQAPLLPKLRGYFAEFLNDRSFARLSIFYPSTCVGLRYGHTCNSP